MNGVIWSAMMKMMFGRFDGVVCGPGAICAAASGVVESWMNPLRVIAVDRTTLNKLARLLIYRLLFHN